MFRRERSIPLRGSAAALCNNLSVLQLPAHNLTHFGVVHGPSAQLLSAASEGVPLAQRQLHAKEGTGVSPSLITQVHWCVLPFRVLLVLTSHRGIQYRLCLPEELLLVATSSAWDCMTDVVTADDSGLLCVWRSGPEFKLLTHIPGFGVPCPSVQMWQGIIAAGYGNGQVRLYEASTGTLHVQINAHARAICALDLAPNNGKLLSAAEDTFVHIWKLSRSPESDSIEVEHCHGECVPDTQVCGAQFCDPSGSSFAVTGYDLAEILRFRSV
ncbi:WD repeat-containing protein 54 isoform X4 [Tamandua tetradactyla]|uniref:WD repeat-containing protein 54 isoform X4 n=1 Tax=Tamandua tetradactyla TaxID=48850 RepID=UPI0040545DC5